MATQNIDFDNTDEVFFGGNSVNEVKLNNTTIWKEVAGPPVCADCYDVTYAGNWSGAYKQVTGRYMRAGVPDWLGVSHYDYTYTGTDPNVEAEYGKSVTWRLIREAEPKAPWEYPTGRYRWVIRGVANTAWGDPHDNVFYSSDVLCPATYIDNTGTGFDPTYTTVEPACKW